MSKITINKKNCKGCELCINACKKNVIALSENEINHLGYKVVEVKKEKIEFCTLCACCAIMCPDLCIELDLKK